MPINFLEEASIGSGALIQWVYKIFLNSHICVAVALGEGDVRLFMKGLSDMQDPAPPSPSNSDLKHLLRTGNPAFWGLLKSKTISSSTFSELVGLNNLRKRAGNQDSLSSPKESIRIAIVGGSSLHPFSDLVEHFTSVILNKEAQIWTGDFDNYVSEISTDDSELYDFSPAIVFILPSERRCVFSGQPSDPIAAQIAQANVVAQDILALCSRVHDKSGAQVVLGNFRLPPNFDPGPMRYTGIASDYGFRKYVNMELGLNAPSFVTICDIEFLANRLGTLASTDRRTWFESKQPFSTALMVSVAREFAMVASSLKKASKKVAVLDLDNTLWGGVIGDDGLDGIEIGTTSAIGEAYRDFQLNLLALSKRGVLLAVCSKNDIDKAMEPFKSHPEMVLRLSDIAMFTANWEPKSENIRRIALDLNLGLDSLVFFDDNPAEIDIVKQFVPEVSAIWLGDDPSTYSQQLLDCRYFEQRSVTSEDQERTKLYQQEAERSKEQQNVTDMDAYLRSLEMTAQVSPFTSIDIPRITQLINKSNQFNLTTIRRTESEVSSLLTDPAAATFTVRLGDKFGDYGLIAVVVCKVSGNNFLVDTWLMSCRVLKRQVEELTLNTIVKLAKERGCKIVVGTYIPTAKNSMVRDLYSDLGFSKTLSDEARTEFVLALEHYITKETHISVA